MEFPENQTTHFNVVATSNVNSTKNSTFGVYQKKIEVHVIRGKLTATKITTSPSYLECLV